MTSDRLHTLFTRYHKGEASAEEIAELHNYLSAMPDREAQLGLLLQRMWDEQEEPDARFADYKREEMWQAIMQEQQPPVKKIAWLRYAAAAVFLCAVAGTAYLFLHKRSVPSFTQTTSPANDALPGHNGAVLRLSNGQTIVLDSLADGTVAHQGNIQVIKENGMIKYAGTSTDPVYNEITTDRGRQWQLTLPDGSKVWLNAASSIRYPLYFNGADRTVETTGEVYFEVAHNDKQPFKVKTGDLLVEDLGTAFNINAYTDESSVSTTLVEGKVKVIKDNNAVLLKPGQQARDLENSKPLSVVNNVNLEEITAWKNGMFHYENADIKTILRQFSRWYNINVHYEGAVPSDRYFMIMNRNSNLSSALKVLQAAGIHFRIEGQHLYVNAAG